jgi:hypothetical protein
MKKILILMLGVSLPLFGLSSLYEQKKVAFQKQLFNHQKLIKNYDQYVAFITPYLDEAENGLLLASYFKKHPESKYIDTYFDILASTNAMCFIYLRNNPSLSPVMMPLHPPHNKLLPFITMVIGKADLNGSAVEEYSNTMELLFKANRAFVHYIDIQESSTN